MPRFSFLIVLVLCRGLTAFGAEPVAGPAATPVPAHAPAPVPSAHPRRPETPRPRHETPPELGSRENHRLGFLLGVAAEPIPSIVGLNVAYNLTDFFRLQGGLGYIGVSDAGLDISTTTLSGEAQLFIPGFSFSPVALLGVGYLSGTIRGRVDNQTAGLTAATSFLFFGGGLDWQAPFGFSFQIHYKYLPMAASGLPGVALGWFF